MKHFGRKAIAFYVVLLSAMEVLSVDKGPYTQKVNGIVWKYYVDVNEKYRASIRDTAINKWTTGAIAIPTTLGGYPVTEIGSHAFDGCSSLTSVTIPKVVTYIGGSAFYGCSSLTNVTIPSGVTYIDYRAFYECTSLQSVSIPEGVAKIEQEVFSNCNSLTSVSIPSSVTSIGMRAFWYCSSLASVSIPSNVKTINTLAFYKCKSLKRIVIPSSVTTLGVGVFAGCTNLQAIDVESENPSFSSQDGVLFNKNKSKLLACPAGLQGSYVIPSSVTWIGYSGFDGCEGLTNVVIHDGIRGIEGEAFYGCTGLSQITIPSSVTSFGYGVFYGCTGLSRMTIPASVTRFDSNVFYGCKNLNSIDFEGAPPVDITVASIKQDAAIRYNVVYQDKWKSVIETCGWTNASPYTPDSMTTVIRDWVANDLAVHYAKPGESTAGYRVRFESKFGANYTASFTKETGKIGQDGTQFCVCHDYIAGTDPTDTNSVFAANVEMHDEGVVITWQPDLNEGGKKKERTYKIWGSENLDDWEWPTNALHRFFKVTVQMK